MLGLGNTILEPTDIEHLYSLELDGNSDYLELADGSNVCQSTLRGSFSISMWIKPDDGQRYIRIQKGLASLAGNNSSTGATTDAAGKVGVTTSANFFTSAMLADSNVSNGLYPRIRIANILSYIRNHYWISHISYV